MSKVDIDKIISLAKKAEPQVEGTLSLKGLKDRVTVVRDRWGIPHIYAENIENLLFAQGFVHAQDRLWQMELFRRTVSGTLCEIFGEATLDSDMFIRTMGLRRTAEEEAKQLLESKHDRLREIYDPYIRGVNSSIDIQRETLPLEFTLLNHRPSKWAVTDSIIIMKMMAWNLSSNWLSELFRLELFEKLGEKRASELLPFKVTEHSSIVPSMRPNASGDIGLGSNNWVIDGEKSETGKPILANDPHLSIMTPSIWYENHLICPGMNVIGATIVGFPGVIIGHNENIAWGITNSGADVQDLFVEKINSEDDTEVLYDDEWKKMKIITEKFNVRGGEAVEKRIRITRHGPIIDSYPIGRKAPNYKKIQGEENFSLRWIGHDSTVELALAVLKINQAENWEEFKDGLKYFYTPSSNLVYADINGNIGYYMTGRVPIRRKGQGLLPVPGWTGEYEWDGYIPFDELPQSYNPSTHFIATANNKIVSDDYPYHITHEWSSPYRIRRIVQLLSEKRKLNIEDFKRIQGDFTSLRAKELLPFFLNVKMESERQRMAQESLLSWDCELGAESQPALIYEFWLSKLVKNLLLDKLGENLYKRYINRADILNLLKYPSEYWFPGESNSNFENRDRMIPRSLDEALDEIESLLGEDTEKWRWGKIHTVTFSHALSSIPGLSQVLDRGPLERGGDRTTVNNTGFDSVAGFEQFWGASYRQIINLDDFSRSVSTHTLGQSGHPFTKHYDDFIPLWHNVKYHPMLFDRSDIEQNEESRLILSPVS